MKKYTGTLLLLFFAFSFLLTGCLKDKDYDNGLQGNVIDKNVKIAEIAGPLDKFINVDLIGADTDTTVDIVRVRLASAAAADKDIQVTLALDPTIVDAFNTEHGTHYVVPASTLFTIPSLNVIIPKGSREGNLQIRARPNMLFGSEYALGVKLASVSDPAILLSSNFDREVIGLTIRNKYDGVYTMAGSLQDHAVSTITTKSPTEVQLITTGTNSVYLRNSGTGNPGFLDLFPILSGGAESGYGSFTPEFIFDANNHITTVVNAYGQPAGNTRSAAIDPSGINTWDPATRTLKVKWFMYQPSVIAGVRTYFDFSFTYEGSR